MSDKDQHTPMYSSSDIEKYLNGELSATEMHALERAALDDPFLADALDGIMIHRHLPERPPFQEDVAELQQRLQNRIAKDKTRVRPLFMRYAAILILLAGLGLTAYYTFLHKEPAKISIAKQERQPAPAASATVPPSDTKKAQSLTDTPLTEPATDKQSESEAKRTARNTTHRPAISAREPVTPSPSQKDSEINTADAVASNQIRLEEKEPQNKAKAEANGQSLAIQPSPKAALGKLQVDTARNNAIKAALAYKLEFSGKVTDPHNNPLPGAYLALKNNQNINAVTDKNGFFNLRLNNKIDTNSAVLVNHAGYEQGYMLLNTENKKGNLIQLQPQAVSLNEVEIVGYGAKRKEIMRQNIDAEHKALSLVAVPAAGWPAYKEYLESGKQSANLDSTLRGDETISFIVNRKGELSSFKVEQSISPAHDSATIRMIKQGPAWQLLSGKRARARVILTY